MKWRTSINAAWFPGALRGRGDVREMMRLVAEAGFDGVELLYTGAGALSDLSGHGPGEARAAAAESRIDISGISTLLNWTVPFTSDGPDVRARGIAHVLAMIGLAEALRCATVSVSAGDRLRRGAAAPPSREEARARAVECFRRVAPRAAGAGVTICLENVWSEFVTSADDLRSLVDEVGSPAVAACLDVGNAQRYGDAPAWIEALGPRLRKVHATDFVRAPRQCIARAGEGCVDWRAVRGALARAGFGGSVVAECHPPPGIDLRTLLAAERRALERVFAGPAKEEHA